MASKSSKLERFAEGADQAAAAERSIQAKVDRKEKAGLQRVGE